MITLVFYPLQHWILTLKDMLNKPMKIDAGKINNNYVSIYGLIKPEVL